MIKMIDLQSQKRRLEDYCLSDDLNIFISEGRFIGGELISELESKLASYVGSTYAIACASGTDAIMLSLKSLNLSSDHVVFVPAFTFAGTLEAVYHAGAIPVLVDIEPYTYTMSIDSLRTAIDIVRTTTKLSPKIILAVDMFGQPADYNSLEYVAKEYNLFIVGDSAQSLGSRSLGVTDRRAEVSCTSFYPTKPLGCYGDGGMCFTSTLEIADSIRSLANHGCNWRAYRHDLIGHNSRLDAIQALILLKKMNIFDLELRSRMLVASAYNNAFNEVSGIYNPPDSILTTSAWAQYSVRFNTEDIRNKVESELLKNSIESAIHYPKPLHFQRAYFGLGYAEGDLPVSEEVSKTILSLPNHPYLTNREIKKVIEVVVEVLK